MSHLHTPEVQTPDSQMFSPDIQARAREAAEGLKAKLEERLSALRFPATHCSCGAIMRPERRPVKIQISADASFVGSWSGWVVFVGDVADPERIISTNSLDRFIPKAEVEELFRQTFESISSELLQDAIFDRIAAEVASLWPGNLRYSFWERSLVHDTSARMDEYIEGGLLPGECRTKEVPVGPGSDHVYEIFLPQPDCIVPGSVAGNMLAHARARHTSERLAAMDLGWSMWHDANTPAPDMVGLVKNEEPADGTCRFEVLHYRG